MARSTIRTLALLILALPTAAVGAWAMLAPSSWYLEFPGFGRHWASALGPYNEHLVRDFGSAYVAIAALLVFAAYSRRLTARRAAPAIFLIFALPHFIFHLLHTAELGTTDNIVNLAVLALSVAVPVALLITGDELRPGRAGASANTRIAPSTSKNPIVMVAAFLSRRRYGHVLGPVGVTAHQPMLLAGFGTFELTLERCNAVGLALKELAATRAAMLTGCAFCIDFGSALVTELGFSRQQLGELPSWRESDAFAPTERLVLEYSEALSVTPVTVDDELFDRLKAEFDDAQIVELTAVIAFENYRGRFNHALGLGSEGFCDSVPPAEQSLAN